MWTACQASYDSRRRTYRIDSVAISTMIVAAQIPNSEAVTPARLRNVCATGVPPSSA
jgi:hypothetical protein